MAPTSVAGVPSGTTSGTRTDMMAGSGALVESPHVPGSTPSRWKRPSGPVLLLRPSLLIGGAELTPSTQSVAPGTGAPLSSSTRRPSTLARSVSARAIPLFCSPSARVISVLAFPCGVSASTTYVPPGRSLSEKTPAVWKKNSGAHERRLGVARAQVEALDRRAVRA